LIQRYRLSGLNGDDAVAAVKAVETLTMVDRAVLDMAAGELVVEGEAEEAEIRAMVAAAGGEIAERL
jgi:hypothetical protein